MVAVNGWVLGRFDESSAQRTLYVPRTVLRAGINEVLLVETSVGTIGADIENARGKTGRRGISFVGKPDLGSAVPL